MVEHLQWIFFAKIPSGVELLTFSQENLHPHMQRPAQVFSCEYCKIFKNTYFEKLCELLLLEIGTSVTNLPK